MAKVGRAARVASRQRVETVSADKTIASAETGELYLVTAASVITLPALQNGAYFKFMVHTTITGANALKIVSADGMRGSVHSIIRTNGSACAVHYENNARATGSETFITIGASAKKTEPGTTVECYCDGTNWVVQAVAYVDHADAIAAFGT